MLSFEEGKIRGYGKHNLHNCMFINNVYILGNQETTLQPIYRNVELER